MITSKVKDFRENIKILLTRGLGRYTMYTAFDQICRKLKSYSYKSTIKLTQLYLLI